MSEGVNAVAVSIAVSPTTETTTTAAEATTKTVRASSTTKTTMRTTLENRDEPESQQAHSPPPPHAHTKPHVKKHRKYCISNKTFLWIDGRKIRSALKKSQQRPRKVSFPSDDTELVTGYLEPANPWEHAENVNIEDLISSYKTSCERHCSEPLQSVVAQLEKLDINGDERCPELSLKNEPLDQYHCDPLEEILKRVQFEKLDLEAASLDDESAVILFDMLEYYQSATHLDISGNRNIGSRGWTACAQMIKKTTCLEQLEARDIKLTQVHMNILKRPLQLISHLHVLKLENCGLAGRAFSVLVSALKQNTGLKELYLADNGLDQDDAIQLGALLRVNNNLQLLDISNNQIKDEGVRDLLDGLIIQSGDDRDGKGLSILVLWNNELTRSSSASISQAIEQSITLETLNVGKNSVSNELLEAATHALIRTQTLLQLGMQSTNITCKGALLLADIIERNQSLQRIDLRDNNIQMTGLTALSLAMKRNTNITQLDLDDNPWSKTQATMDQYFDLVADIRRLCVRNEEPTSTSESTEESSSPQHRSRLSSVSSRKISLTCQTLPRSPPSMTPIASDIASRSMLEPKRTSGGRLRSPAPSPIPSPIASPVPSPSRGRFVVSRVSESSLSSTNSSISSSPITPSSLPSSPTCFFPPGGGGSGGGSSRFRVTLVESAALHQTTTNSVVTSGNSNVTIGFNYTVQTPDSNDSDDSDGVFRPDDPRTGNESSASIDISFEEETNSASPLETKELDIIVQESEIETEILSNNQSNIEPRILHNDQLEIETEISRNDRFEIETEISRNDRFEIETESLRNDRFEIETESLRNDRFEIETEILRNDRFEIETEISRHDQSKIETEILPKDESNNEDNQSDNGQIKVEDQRIENDANILTTDVTPGEDSTKFSERETSKKFERDIAKIIETKGNTENSSEDMLKNEIIPAFKSETKKSEPVQRQATSLERLLGLFHHPGSLFSGSSFAEKTEAKNPIQDGVNSMIALGDKFQQYLRDSRGTGKSTTEDSSSHAPLQRSVSDASRTTLKIDPVKSLSIPQLSNIQVKCTRDFTVRQVDSSLCADSTIIHTTPQSLNLTEIHESLPKSEIEQVPRISSDLPLPENLQSSVKDPHEKIVESSEITVATASDRTEFTTEIVNGETTSIVTTESKTTVSIPKLKDIPEYSVLEIIKSSRVADENVSDDTTSRNYKNVEDKNTDDYDDVETKCDSSTTDSINDPSCKNSSLCKVTCDISGAIDVHTLSSTTDDVHNFLNSPLSHDKITINKTPTVRAMISNYSSEVDDRAAATVTETNEEIKNIDEEKIVLTDPTNSPPENSHNFTIDKKEETSLENNSLVAKTIDLLLPMLSNLCINDTSDAQDERVNAMTNEAIVTEDEFPDTVEEFLPIDVAAVSNNVVSTVALTHNCINNATTSVVSEFNIIFDEDCEDKSAIIVTDQKIPTIYQTVGETTIVERLASSSSATDNSVEAKNTKTTEDDDFVLPPIECVSTSLSEDSDYSSKLSVDDATTNSPANEEIVADVTMIDNSLECINSYSNEAKLKTVEHRSRVCTAVNVTETTESVTKVTSTMVKCSESTEDLMFKMTDIISTNESTNAIVPMIPESANATNFSESGQSSRSPTNLFIDDSRSVIHRNSQDSGIEETTVSMSDDNGVEGNGMPQGSFQESVDSGIESECSSVCARVDVGADVQKERARDPGKITNVDLNEEQIILGSPASRKIDDLMEDVGTSNQTAANERSNVVAPTTSSE